MSLNIGIFIFDQVEVLDFAGPYEVLTTAARVYARSAPREPPLFSVFTIGRTSEPVCARAGLKIAPDFTIDQHPVLDCLIVPGGVINTELSKGDVISWIDAQAGKTPLTASVCTGAFLLAKTGRLDGQEVTHPLGGHRGPAAHVP